MKKYKIRFIYKVYRKAYCIEYKSFGIWISYRPNWGYSSKEELVDYFLDDICKTTRKYVNLIEYPEIKIYDGDDYK